MKTAKEYASEYREIAKNLGIQGDQVELLCQLLAHFSYTNEIDNLSVANEAVLERALLPSSKIEHCVEQMYSVFRGRCPRVILRFRPTKFFEFGPYDTIYKSGSIGVYYLGYLNTTGDAVDTGTGLYGASLATNDGSLGFTYAPVTVQPSETGYVTILGMVAKEYVQRDFVTSQSNTYYVDLLDSGFSGDLWVKLGKTGSDKKFVDTTREFQEHLLGEKVFDLTLPDWGTRLYFPESYREANTKVTAQVFKYTTESDLSMTDIKGIKISGSELVEFTDLPDGLTEIAPGVVFLPEISREDLATVHYKANQDRYMGSVLRSNSDVGDLLKEMYPLKVKNTNYSFKTAKETVTSTQTPVVISTYDKYLRSNIVTYSTGDKYLDFSVSPETVTGITVHVSSTNETSPSTITYSIQTESPVSMVGIESTPYVVKSEVDSEGDLVTSVLRPTDLADLGLTLQYRYSRSDSWTSLTDHDTIPARSVVETEEDTTESIGGTESETITTDPEGNITTVLTKSTSTQSTKSTDTSLSATPVSKEPLYLRLIKRSTAIVLDQEAVPFIDSTTTYFGSTDKNYVFPVTPDLQFLLDYTEKPVRIPTLLFVNGSSVTAEEYSVLSHSKELLVSVTPEGVIEVSGLTKVTGTYTAVIQATYNNIRYTTVLTVETTATEDAKPRILQVYYKVSKGTYQFLKEYEVWTGTTINISDPLSLLPSGITTGDTVVFGLACKDSLDYEDAVVATEEEEEEGAGAKANYLIDFDLPVSTESTKKLGYLVTGDTSIIRESQETTEVTRTKVNEIILGGITVTDTIRVTENLDDSWSKIVIYYVPQNSSDLLSDQEKSNFLRSRSCYYITDNIDIRKGSLINVTVDLRVLLYQGSLDSTDVTGILDKYSGKFNLDLGDLTESIRSQISKITEIARVKYLGFVFKDESGKLLKITDIDSSTSYFDFTLYVSTDIM